MDKQKELYDHYRSVINDLSLSYREGMSSNATQATEMGKLLIQSLLLLHGGAIIAIPNFIPTLVGQDKVGTYTFWIMFSLFLLGLILAVMAAALGFYVLSSRADGNNKMISWAYESGWARVYGIQLATQYDEGLDEKIKAADKQAEAAESEADIFFERSVRLMNWALGCAWASIGCLIFGSIAGAVLAVL